MKLHTLLSNLFITTTLLLASPVWADASLNFPSSVELLVVNGQATEAISPVTLTEGKNQIVFKFNTSFRQQGQQKRFSSEAIILSFETSNQVYNLILPKLKTSNDADKFNSTLDVDLSDENGNKISYKCDLLIKNGLQLGRDYPEEVAAYNATSSIAAIGYLASQSKPVVKTYPVTTPIASVTKSGSEIKVSDNQAMNTDQINVGQMLDYWYQQADEGTRKAFKARIKSK